MVSTMPWSPSFGLRHCRIRSIVRVIWPVAAMAVARLIAVVVLPTPPFWLAMAMTLDTLGPRHDQDGRVLRPGDLDAEAPLPPRRLEFLVHAHALREQTHAALRQQG